MSERTFRASDDELYSVLGYVEEELERLNCPMKAVMQVIVCVEEIFVNIAHYAYGGEDGSMKLRVSPAEGGVELCFTDSGMPFDPLSREDPDTTLPAEERDAGGLGILMVKKFMDSAEYRYEDGQNIFTVVRQF